jgi:translin
MIDKEDFKGILKDLKEADDRREKLIQISRDIIRESKLIIYGLQRGEKVDIKKMQSLVKSLKKEYVTGIEDTALQEYVEALAFYHFVQNRRIPTRKELGVDTENYLMGLCDLTGELMRKAVKDVIEGDYKSAKEITCVVEDIYGEFLKFDLRNGTLRQKADSIKWNLQKLEQLVLEVSKKV